MADLTGSLQSLERIVKAVTSLGDALQNLVDGIAHLAKTGFVGVDALAARRARDRLLEVRREVSIFWGSYNSTLRNAMETMAKDLRHLLPAYSKWREPVSAKERKRIAESYAIGGREATQEAIDKGIESGWTKMLSLVRKAENGLDQLESAFVDGAQAIVLEATYVNFVTTFAERRQVYALLADLPVPTTKREMDLFEKLTEQYVRMVSDLDNGKPRTRALLERRGVTAS